MSKFINFRKNLKYLRQVIKVKNGVKINKILNIKFKAKLFVNLLSINYSRARLINAIGNRNLLKTGILNKCTQLQNALIRCSHYENQ
jgi:hypothetical protein